MMSLSRMIPLALAVTGLSTSGCSTWPSPFSNQSHSARTRDRASLDEPNADSARVQENTRPATERGTKPGNAMHYYEDQRVAMVARPARYSASELPRVEVWWTDNNGFHWHKAGRFVQGQGFFPLDFKEDGDYGIRFVGPGDEPAQRVLAFPERTYHIDTVKPEVQVLIDPEQVDFHVGDLVSIDWMVQDFQLEEFPVIIEVLLGHGDAHIGPVEFQRDLPDEGSVTYCIPPEALGREISFRVEAKDRSGNVGLAHSGVLRVVEDPMAAELAEAEVNESEIGVTDSVVVVARESENEAAASVPAEEENPLLVVGPILVPIENDAEEAVAAEEIEPTPSVSDKTANLRRAAKEAELARVTRLASELKSRATMLVSRVAEVMGGVLDGWKASASLASIKAEAETQAPVPVAVVAVGDDDAEEGSTDDDETLDLGQAAQAPPTFAVLEQSIDESAADVALQELLLAIAAETETEETEPLDASPDAAPTNQTPPDAPSLAASHKDMADEEDSPPDRVAIRSSDLPFATAIARLPAIDPQVVDEEFAGADFPDDDAPRRGPDATEPTEETTETTSEEDIHPQVFALAYAEQETDGPEQTDDTSVARDLADDEPLEDAALAEETVDAIDDPAPAAIETAASAEQGDTEEPVLPVLSLESLNALDPTRGNGLLVPMPATLEDEPPPLRVTAHPWRILGRQSGSMEETVWALPERQSDVRWRPVFTGRFLADDPAPRDLAEPHNATPPTLAGTTEEMIDGEGSDEP